MSSIFSKIISREIQGYIIAENKNCIAFLDAFPIKKGHTLVVPKNEVDNIFDLPEEEYSYLFKFAQRISVAIKNAIICRRIGLAVIGFEVPHAHIHLIPINKTSELNFQNKKLQLSPIEFDDILKSIKMHL